MDEVLFPWRRLFSALNPFGMTVTLGQVSPMVCRHFPMAGGGGVSLRTTWCPPFLHLPMSIRAWGRPSEELTEPLRRDVQGMGRPTLTPSGISHGDSSAPWGCRDLWPLTAHQEGQPWRVSTSTSLLHWWWKQQAQGEPSDFPGRVGLGKPIRTWNKPLASVRGHGKLCEQQWLLRPSRPPPHLEQSARRARRQPPVPRLSRKPPFCREKLMKGRSLGNYELPPAIFSFQGKWQDG